MPESFELLVAPVLATQIDDQIFQTGFMSANLDLGAFLAMRMVMC